MRLLFQIAISLLFCLPFSVRSQNVYQVPGEYPVQPLVQHLQILADSNHSLNPEQVRKLPDSAFTRRQTFGRFLAIGPAYWARVTLQTTDSLTGWVLDFDDILKNNIAWIRSTGKVDVYGFSNDTLLFHKKTGVDYPRQERERKDHWVLNRVNLDLPLQQPVTLVIRVESNSFGFFPSLQATLRAPAYLAYHDFLPLSFSFHIFVLGVTFIAFFYHLLQFLYLKQRIFFWFSVWTLLCTLTQLMAVGADAEYLIPEFPKLRYLLWFIFPNGMLFAFWFFGREFVKSYERYPRLDKVMLALPLVMGLNILGYLLWYLVGTPEVKFTIIGWHYYFVAAYSVVGLVLAISLILKQDSFARYFGVGAIFATAATLLGALWALFLIRLPFDPFTWGILVQLVIYSFGIAYRQQQINQQATEEHLANERSRAELLRIKDLNEVKARFFTNLSHEFRTPLSLIVSPLQQAEKQQQVPEPHVLAMIRRNAERLQQLVEQLLELAQLENSQVKLQLKQGKLVAFLRSLVYAFESYAEGKNISLNTSFMPELPDAWYDADKLEKIVTNLLSNALKYTPYGGVVHVQLFHSDQHFTLLISDSGPGIAPPELSQVFERFYRAEGNEEKGSGIGLALTKELVELCHGQISVQSEQGRGTSFKVRLPYSRELLPVHAVVSKEEKASLHLEVAPQRPEAMSNGAEEAPLVLIAEDNSDMAAYLSEIIQAEAKVMLACDGLQAERLALEHVPDLIITDVMMPKKDGYALCHALKNNPKTSHIPLIILTAKVSPQDRRDGLGQGADAYLIKPFDAEAFKLLMRNLLQSKQKLWMHFSANEQVLVKDLPLKSLDDTFLQQVLSYIKEHLDDENLNAEQIGRAIGFSRSQVHRKLKALTSKSASQLIAEIRLNEARAMLVNKAGTVSEVAFSVGYANLSYFTKSFKEKFGVLPSKVDGVA